MPLVGGTAAVRGKVAVRLLAGRDRRLLLVPRGGAARLQRRGCAHGLSGRVALVSPRRRPRCPHGVRALRRPHHRCADALHRWCCRLGRAAGAGRLYAPAEHRLHRLRRRHCSTFLRSSASRPVGLCWRPGQLVRSAPAPRRATGEISKPSQTITLGTILELAARRWNLGLYSLVLTRARASQLTDHR
jgi:hypothetical protein